MLVGRLMGRLVLGITLLLTSYPVMVRAQDMPEIPCDQLGVPCNEPPTAPLQSPPSNLFWSTSIFTDILQLYQRTMTDSRWPLFEIALSLLHWLAVLEVALVWIGLALSDDAQSLLGTMAGQLLLIGFCVELVSQFPTYSQLWSDGCVWIGLQIGSVVSLASGKAVLTVAEFQDPGAVILKGLGQASHMFSYLATLSESSWWGVIESYYMSIPITLAFLAATVANFLIGILITIAWLLAWTVTAFSIPFLPFIILKATRRIGIGALMATVGAGIDLGALATITSLMNGVADAIGFADAAQINAGTAISTAAVGWLFVSLALILPKRLRSAMGVHGSFGSGSVRAIAGAGKAVVSLVKG